MVLLFSCANATCAVPEAYREIFRGSEDAVASSEGWEPGSLNLGQAFAIKFRSPLIHGDVTRLLIDFEQDGDQRWSRFSLKLPEATRAKVADRHERPFRAALQMRIAEDLRRHDAVMHLMIHTDAATDGRVVVESIGTADLGEKFAASWCARLRTADLDVTHRRHGLPVPLALALQAEQSPDQYAQIRLSVSQSFFLAGTPWRWETLKKHLLETLAQTVSSPA